MERVNVDSSSLTSIGYDGASQQLEVEFKKGGVYRYDGVPQKVHAALMAAESSGAFFAKNIRNVYPATRLDG
jgi:hypothetical protein